MKRNNNNQANSPHDELLDFQRQWRQENEEMKFDLFVQSRRVREIHQALHKILIQEDQAQTTWFEQNQELVDRLLDSLMRDSVLALDGVELDSETMRLSEELIGNIKEATDLIYHLAHAEDLVKH